MKAFRQDSAERGAWSEIPIPQEIQERAQEYREKLMDEVSEVSDSLMERYLEGDSISHQEIVDALKEGTNHGKIFPVVCGVATRNLGTTRLLDAIVEDLPSPVKHGALQVGEVELRPTEDGELFAYVFKTRADPFAGGSTCCASTRGAAGGQPCAQHARTHEGEDRPVAPVQRQGCRARPGVRSGRHRRGRQAQGDPRRRLARCARRADRHAGAHAPAAVMAFAVEPKSRVMRTRC